jgi:acyl-CoA synthetase (AMP-forming)/AMP-acid ligase II
MSTLIDLLERAQEKEHTGFIFVDRKEKETEYNFRDVYTRTQIAAANLQLLGIKKGDCVALFLPTSIEFMDAFLGAQYIGAIPYSQHA